jgi:predicted DNA-binding antitoxin AbrB/MazE fold protein
MNQRIDAIFENGVFRPEVPVHILNGQRVRLDVEAQLVTRDDLRDVQDLLDADCVKSCGERASAPPSLGKVRKV